MSEKLPIVIYTFRGMNATGGRDFGFGYLIEREGKQYCVSDEGRAESQPLPLGTFEIDSQLLRKQPRREFDRNLYHYLKEVESRQPRPHQQGF
jgi:hypothetical protein